MMAHPPVPVPAPGPPVYFCAMNAVRPLALLLLLLPLLVACGQKGPLYLPEPQAEVPAGTATG